VRGKGFEGGGASRIGGNMEIDGVVWLAGNPSGEREALCTFGGKVALTRLVCNILLRARCVSKGPLGMLRRSAAKKCVRASSECSGGERERSSTCFRNC
jgi:hypothetical protein